jgi:hypothetical protein
MSLNQPETKALRSIADGLAGSDPRLASMLTIFSQLAAGEEMPAREKIRARRGRRHAERKPHSTGRVQRFSHQQPELPKRICTR